MITETEIKNRFEQLPDKVGAYLEVGRLVRSPLITESVKPALKDKQLNLLDSLDPKEFNTLVNFLTWRQQYLMPERRRGTIVWVRSGDERVCSL